MSIERSAPSKRIMRQANKFLFLDEDLELALEAFSQPRCSALPRGFRLEKNLSMVNSCSRRRNWKKTAVADFALVWQQLKQQQPPALSKLAAEDQQSGLLVTITLTLLRLLSRLFSTPKLRIKRRQRYAFGPPCCCRTQAVKLANLDNHPGRDGRSRRQHKVFLLIIRRIALFHTNYGVKIRHAYLTGGDMLRNFGGGLSFCLDLNFVSKCGGIHFFLTNFSALEFRRNKLFCFQRGCEIFCGQLCVESGRIEVTEVTNKKVLTDLKLFQKRVLFQINLLF